MEIVKEEPATQETAPTLESIGKEYSQDCAALGELFYKGTVYSEHMDSLIQKIKGHNARAAELRVKEPTNVQG